MSKRRMRFKKVHLIYLLILVPFATDWYGDYRVKKGMKHNEHFFTCGELVYQKYERNRVKGYFDIKVRSDGSVNDFQSSTLKLPSSQLFFGTDKSDFKLGDDICVEWINHDYIIKPQFYNKEIHVIDVFLNKDK